jgi:hypothetical protein
VVKKQQLNAELAIARQALLVANLRIKAEGKSKEARKQAQALTGIVIFKNVLLDKKVNN